MKPKAHPEASMNQALRLQGEVGTVTERLAKARQERAAKVAFAQKLTAAPKRRK